MTYQGELNDLPDRISLILQFRTHGGRIELSPGGGIVVSGPVGRVYALMEHIRRGFDEWKHCLKTINVTKNELTLDLIYGQVDREKIEEYRYQYCSRVTDPIDFPDDFYIIADRKKMSGKGTVTENAKMFIENALRRKPRHASEVIANGEKLGYTQRVMRKAAAEMGIVRQRVPAQNTWLWSLPERY